MDKPPQKTFAERFPKPAAAGTGGMARSHAEQLIARNRNLVHRITANDTTGRRACYFIYVERAKEALFLAALKRNEIVHLETYGRVIAACYGDEPTEEVKRLLWEKYGYPA